MTAMKIRILAAFAATLASAAADAPAPVLPYVIPATGQTTCYGDRNAISPPAKGAPYAGQDARHPGPKLAYRDNGDGTVTDLNTGLMWVKRPDFLHKKTQRQAAEEASACRVAGHDDWRLPNIKELYSLFDFGGSIGGTFKESRPYIDAKAFDFAYGDTRKERLIDAQYATTNLYVGKTTFAGGGPMMFGVNFADGRLKGYGLGPSGSQKTFFVRYVRGNPRYGVNDFHDNGDGTVTDRATGKMWQKSDSGKGMNWKDALAYAESLKLAGKSDWRVPNAKELQSIVDYSRAPDADDAAKRGPAIDPVFSCSDADGWYWTGTTLAEGMGFGSASAIYITFGKGWGHMSGQRLDVHGAGCQRSDPKSGDPSLFPQGRGPQGDEVRIFNLVRCVRDAR